MKIPTGITRTAAKALHRAKKKSPHIFFGIGVTGVASTVVLACKATLKVEDILDEGKEKAEEVNAMRESSLERNTTYAAKEYPRDILYVKTQTALAVGKLYAPTIVVGVISIAALTGAHVQLTRRNTALMGSLSMLAKAFDEYRERVQEEIGVDRERDIYRNLESVEVLNHEGKKELVKVHKDDRLSPYARVFDESCNGWSNNAEMNYTFIKLQQYQANHQLRAHGFIFLNDVYKMLGLEPSSEGQLVGWYLGGDGDDHVSFGLEHVWNADLAPGHEREAWLDFNVDGVIYDRI